MSSSRTYFDPSINNLKPSILFYLFYFFPLSYAPWCPACQQLQTVWREFADWGDDMGINVAKVDVTEQPGRHPKAKQP